MLNERPVLGHLEYSPQGDFLVLVDHLLGKLLAEGCVLGQDAGPLGEYLRQVHLLVAGVQVHLVVVLVGGSEFLEGLVLVKEGGDILAGMLECYLDGKLVTLEEDSLGNGEVVLNAALILVCDIPWSNSLTIVNLCFVILFLGIIQLH